MNVQNPTKYAHAHGPDNHLGHVANNDHQRVHRGAQPATVPHGAENMAILFLAFVFGMLVLAALIRCAGLKLQPWRRDARHYRAWPRDIELSVLEEGGCQSWSHFRSHRLTLNRFLIHCPVLNQIPNQRNQTLSPNRLFLQTQTQIQIRHLIPSSSQNPNRLQNLNLCRSHHRILILALTRSPKNWSPSHFLSRQLDRCPLLNCFPEPGTVIVLRLLSTSGGPMMTVG
ncbi:hypothetical protein ACJ41O_000939 [Fusarium nematophilum]